MDSQSTLLHMSTPKIHRSDRSSNEIPSLRTVGDAAGQDASPEPDAPQHACVHHRLRGHARRELGRCLTAGSRFVRPMPSDGRPTACHSLRRFANHWRRPRRAAKAGAGPCQERGRQGPWLAAGRELGVRTIEWDVHLGSGPSSDRAGVLDRSGGSRPLHRFLRASRLSGPLPK